MELCSCLLVLFSCNVLRFGSFESRECLERCLLFVNVIVLIAFEIFTKNYRISLQCYYFLIWMLVTGEFHLFALLGFIIPKFD